MPIVKFLPMNKEIEVPKDKILLDVIREIGIFMDTPCNGNGSCGKCKVKVIDGNVVSIPNKSVPKEDLEKGYVLACSSKVTKDVTIKILAESSAMMHGMKIEDISGDAHKEIFERAKDQILKHGMKFKTYVRKDYIEIDEPNLNDNISDFERIKRHLRVKLGFSHVFVRLPLLREMPKLLRKAKFKVTITHIPRGEGKTTIINMEIGDSTSKLYGIALDIGTTSVAACLVDLYSGNLISQASSGNAQLRYGADVINRIMFSTKEDGLEKLNNAIIKETINPLLKKMYEVSGVKKDEVVSIVVAGNTTMSHLFLGIYPNFLRMEPYIPAFVKAPFIKASELELEVNPETFIYIAPCVASYVGGDITAGVLANGMWSADENVLFLDLGTNGEIVFGNKEFLMTCACSAGPAFEGGEISCGMRATAGAIEKVSIDPKTFKPKVTVIGDVAPIGICGSGIIDLICEMMIVGVIDRRGKLKKDLNINRIRFDENEIGEYVLAFKEECQGDEDVLITEVDIDNFIRAKGAIYSGITMLISSLGLDSTKIDRLLIAGGIGNSLNIENSIRIGMLPDIDRDKISYIGNSSLMGCYLTLMSEDARHKLEETAKHMTYMELSTEPKYMDEFVSSCFLPHTDIERFPSVKKLLEK